MIRPKIKEIAEVMLDPAKSRFAHGHRFVHLSPAGAGNKSHHYHSSGSLFISDLPITLSDDEAKLLQETYRKRELLEEAEVLESFGI